MLHQGRGIVFIPNNRIRLLKWRKVCVEAKCYLRSKVIYYILVIRPSTFYKWFPHLRVIRYLLNERFSSILWNRIKGLTIIQTLGNWRAFSVAYARHCFSQHVFRRYKHVCAEASARKRVEKIKYYWLSISCQTAFNQRVPPRESLD